jgi:hypothetical protein
MSDSDTTVFLSLFPFLFIGMWLAITTILGAMSGWFGLQSEYPRGTDAPLLTIRGLSGYMGLGVNLNGVLTLSACPSGLRVAIRRGFGPFQRPFLVPWSEIAAERKKRFFMPMAQLRFGSPEIGKLTIDAGIWQKLSRHAPPGRRTTAAPLPVVTNQELARGLALQWVVISGFLAAFFTFGFTSTLGPRLPPDMPPAMLLVFIGFPAIALGVAQLIRYARQRE